jgi:hypothetical protein
MGDGRNIANLAIRAKALKKVAKIFLNLRVTNRFLKNVSKETEYSENKIRS